jgi:mono/diheme cytochrome c family protein
MLVARRGYRLLSSIVGLVVGLVTLPALADDVPPRILGYERVYADAKNADVAAGQLLLGELNCTSCHQADASLDSQIQRKPAPVLDSVCSRVKSEYLLKFLADPQATKPGATMPDVLASVPESERAAIVESLVHFLATTGTAARGNPSRHAVNRGETLFHSIGCVACHDPRLESPPPLVSASISLGTPSNKYTLPGLTQFLHDPLAVRPGGRMPHFNLTQSQARDIASYLMNDLELVSGLQYAYYEGEWDALPKFDKLTPIAVGDAEDFDLALARRKDHFALRFEGTIQLPLDGDYLFLIGSDDGSRLLIDDKLVLANDGVHPFEQKRKKVKMTAGSHSAVVEYFEQEGEESLQVDFEGPGMVQQSLATLLTTPAKQNSATAGERFEIDPAKAAKGREYFAALGCAACHALKIDGSLIAAKSTATPLAQLTSGHGCLDPQSNKTPRYALNDRQRSVIGTAIAAAHSPTKVLSTQERVDRTLVRFNCIACHERNKLGGIVAARDEFFMSDMPEMGDEGRLPPSLTGVGAKLTTHWLKTLFDQGAKDRPYMLTRMPKFGLANLSDLPAALEQVDAPLAKAAPAVHMAAADEQRSDEKRIKAAGRRLVGSQGFSCIKCHTFAGQRSSGIQAISLTTMTTRLRRDWFHHYLLSPLAYRPGTRMPTPFPDGQTTLPSVLDGTVNSQIAAIWTYLSDGDKAIYPVGLVTGKMELIAFDEAIIYRNFLEGAGPRAIGVGFPEKLNLAFDADNCRLAMLWHGGFIDAAKHWSARGAGFEKPLGDNVLHLPPGPPLARLADTKTSWPTGATKDLGFQFGGYRLGVKQQPTFLYSWQGIQVEDTPRPIGRDDLFTIQRTVRFVTKQPPSNVWFRALVTDQIDAAENEFFKINNRWTMKVFATGNPLIRQQAATYELLIPVQFRAGEATIELNYDW